MKNPYSRGIVGKKKPARTPYSPQQPARNERPRIENVAERTEGRFQSTKELVRAAREGDPVAQIAWRKSIRALAVAIAAYGMILDLEAVIPRHG